MGKSIIRRSKESSKSNSELSFGFISLFLVMIVLCLTIFSLLSFSTANSDYKLAKKSAENISAYYTADGNIQKTLSAINQLCVDGKSSSEIADAYKDSDTPMVYSQDNQLTIQQAVSSKQYIEAILTIENNSYSINSYVLKSTWNEEYTEMQ